MNAESEATHVSRARRYIAIGIGFLASGVAATVLAYSQFVFTSGGPVPFNESVPGLTSIQGGLVSVHKYFRGWPFVYETRVIANVTAIKSRGITYGPSDSSKVVDQRHDTPLSINIVVCTFLVLGTGIGLGDIVLRARWPPWFSTAGVLIMIIIAGLSVGICLLYVELAQHRRIHVDCEFEYTMVVVLVLTLNAIFSVIRYAFGDGPECDPA